MEECPLRYSKSSVVEANGIGHEPMLAEVCLQGPSAIVKQALGHCSSFLEMCVCVGTL